jgi:hypothetical protein
VWGYLPLGAEDDASYVVDSALTDPPFRLFLVGSGKLEIPHELKNIVLIRDRLSYPGAFHLLTGFSLPPIRYQTFMHS